jgi:hypothetical protein
MIDFLHLPKPQNGYIDYFPGFVGSFENAWQVWNKPRGISFIKIICIGGGGGGGAGHSSATTTARGGGGAGGSGTIGHVTIPAVFLPDRLYVLPGRGGFSFAANGIGGSGGNTYVCIAPDSSLIYRVCFANGSNTASPGSAIGRGPGSSSVTGPNQTTTLLSGIGNFTTLGNGTGGAPGGTHTGAAGNSFTYPTTGMLLSGGGGGAGGAGFAGGDITAPASQTSTYTIFPTLPGGVAGTAGSLAGGDGAAGVNNTQLLLFTGGSGGGSGFDGTAGSVGGRGGDGGIGSGGGGGGAGTTGGNGGNGGPGLVIISCW